MGELTYENALKAMRIANDRGDVESAKKMARLAKSLQGGSVGPERSDFMGQVNAGIGDVVDFFNPLDTPALSQALGMGDKLSTGSAADVMNSVGIRAATDEPEGFVEGFARGGGQAAASGPAIIGGLKALASQGGAIGAAADDALRALQTVPGFAVETVAGGLSRGAEEEVEAEGGNELMQGAAALAAPLSIPAAGSAVRGATRAAGALPVTGYAMRAGRDLKRALVPMSEGGAREVARARVQELAGGEERAAELGRLIDPRDEFGRTGADQTGDENLKGLQRAVELENPVIRESLAAQRAGSQEAIAQAGRDMGGNVADARSFFADRRKEFSANLKERADRAIAGSEADIAAVGPTRGEASNSVAVTSRLKAELDDALQEEGQLWAAVDREALFSAETASEAAQRLIADTPRAQQGDIPRALRAALEDGNELAAPANVNELHGLYSELRRVARSAMAGNDQNKNQARIANAVADAIMEDLGAAAGEGPVGEAINTARAFSRELHETFDRGAVGRILKRTLDGDEVMTPEGALERTVGRGGATAGADNTSIRNAAPGAGQDIQDYLRGRFADAITDASGNARVKVARTWLRNNRDTLNQYPELKKSLYKAVSNRESAEAFAIRAKERLKLAEQGPLKDFNSGQVQKAITAIIGADDPIAAARSIARTARKDTSGQALAGVKGAFSGYLTQDAKKLPALLMDKQITAAMRQVFSPSEMKRWERIAQAQARIDAPTGDVGETINSPANALVEYVVRIASAQQGGAMGGGSMGGSLQTANIFQERARKILRNLTNSKARELLNDAVQDPALFRELLLEPKSVQLPKRTQSKLAPYLAGTATAQSDE